MNDVLAIIHAPGVTNGQSKVLINKLRYFLDRYNCINPIIRINPTLPLKSGNDGIWTTLVIGWGLASAPSWDKLICEYGLSGSTQDFLAFDLFERRGFDGRILFKPMVNAGKYWGQKVREKNLKLFIEGYYLKSTVPYGMISVLKKPPNGRAYHWRSHFVLKPGSSDEIKIVRLIFDLFVNHDYSRTQICNLLTAQSIDPPGKNARWRISVVKTILEDPVYIGANEYKGNFRYDIFPSLIDKSMFYEAQSKIESEQISRIEVCAMNRRYGLI